ncbi:transcription factor 25 [Hyposmocoma kahamanoa]|uniref:transcription factor 25 n=1 Tax=Hyposmocoma kahamanoa TaxID=1477025 RepID=UPI000E6D6450|nr:transcription factor 25 [Hyposmocoma kahamanoa]
MSARHFRKVYGGNELPPPEGDSDEEFVPHYAKRTGSAFAVEGFAISDGESEQDQYEQKDESLDEAAAYPVEDLNKKKKKKKSKKADTRTGNSFKDAVEEMDEVEKCVLEVNAMLGTPEPAAAPEDETLPLSVTTFSVQKKYLDPAKEIKRMFGPTPGENRRRRPTPEKLVLLKKAVLVHMEDMPLNFKRLAISMSIHHRDNNVTYFTFDHSRQYQRMRKESLLTLEQRMQQVILTAQDAQRNLHVEELIENADCLFMLEDYNAANTLVEQAVACFQYVAHPKFNLANPDTRLEYKFLENRAFHVALLKYLYLLSNKACHRTALEICKVMLQLDPLDPLAVLLIIDTLAIRAREYQWLIDATTVWSDARHVEYMFNFKYSNAMAHFHLAYKNKEDLSVADGLLKDALSAFPMVFVKFVECGGSSITDAVKNHALFTTIAEKTTAHKVKDLITVYANLCWSWWREPPVLAWLIRNAKELTAEYDRNPELQAHVNEMGTVGRALFQTLPGKVLRHLQVIKPMASLLMDGTLPQLPSIENPTNPSPSVKCVDRYGYISPPSRVNPDNLRSPLYNLFSSMAPGYNFNLRAEVDDFIFVLHPEYVPEPGVNDDYDDTSPFPIDPNTIRNPTCRSFEAAVVNAVRRMVQRNPEAFNIPGQSQGDANGRSTDETHQNRSGHASQDDNPESGN